MHIWEESAFHSGALCNTNNTRPSWEHHYLVKTYCIQEDKAACEGGRRRCTDRREGPSWQPGGKANRPSAQQKGGLLVNVQWPNSDTTVTTSLLHFCGRFRDLVAPFLHQQNNGLM